MHEVKRGDAVMEVEAVLRTSVEFGVRYTPTGADGLTKLEMCVVSMLVATRKLRKILEWGTGSGLCTRNLAFNASQAQVHTVAPLGARGDAWLKGPRRFGYWDLPDKTQVCQAYGDLADFDFWQVDGWVQFCLIHAGSGEEAREVTRRALPLMIRPGVIVWRDRECLGSEAAECGVADFIRELAPLGAVFIGGMSLALLPLSPGTRSKLAQLLGFEMAE